MAWMGMGAAPPKKRLPHLPSLPLSPASPHSPIHSLIPPKMHLMSLQLMQGVPQRHRRPPDEPVVK